MPSRRVLFRSSPTRLLLAAGLAAAPMLGGCTNPFASHPMDYDRRIDPERARSIAPLIAAAAPTGEGDADPAPDIARARARYEAMDAVSIGLAEARAATLENNLGLRAAVIAPAIAAQSVSEEEGRFASVFTLNGFWSETDTPTASALDGSGTRTQRFAPGLRVPLRTGGEASVSLPITRFETNNQFTTLNPSVESDLEFSLSQNLLRGAGRRTTTHAIRIADYNRQISEVQTKLEVIRQLAAVDRAYWRLYAARKVLEVRLQQHELAVEQLGRAERQNRAGRVADIEVVRASSGVADRVDQIIRAQSDLLLRERALKEIMNIPGLDVDSETILTTGSEPEPVRYLYDRDVLLEAALAERVELLEQELRLAQDAATIAFERNQSLPLLAMSYTYRINGLGGNGGDSFEQLADLDFEDWTVGLNAEVPIDNTQRRSAVARAVLTRLQRLATRDARRQSVRREVLDAIDSIEADWRRILATRESVILNTRALRAEERQFDVGRSTSNDVLDADTRLAESRLSEIEAVVQYEISRVDLAFAAGMTLGSSRVRWEVSDPRNGTDRLGGQGDDLPDYGLTTGLFRTHDDPSSEPEDAGEGTDNTAPAAPPETVTGLTEAPAVDPR